MKQLRESWGWAPGTWGELVQGEKNGQRLLVSLPTHRGTTTHASLYYRKPFATPVICSSKHWKSQKAVQLLLEILGETHVQIHLRFTTTLQSGVGNASSSADIFSALNATLNALGRRISPALLCNIASRIEPTNPTIIPEACLFEPDRGLILGKGRLPAFDVLPLSCGESIDTMQALLRRPRWKDNERLAFNRILELLRTAIGRGSLKQLAAAATRSAFLYAERHSRSDIWTAWLKAQSMGALGIAASHSGSSIVALLPPKGSMSYV